MDWVGATPAAHRAPAPATWSVRTQALAGWRVRWTITVQAASIAPGEPVLPSNPMAPVAPPATPASPRIVPTMCVAPVEHVAPASPNAMTTTFAPRRTAPTSSAKAPTIACSVKPPPATTWSSRQRSTAATAVVVWAAILQIVRERTPA